MTTLITTTTEVFTFEELSDTAKQTAIDNHRDWNVDFEWWDTTIEDFNNILDELGFFQTNNGQPSIYFSGFWSQGDGASFYNFRWEYKKGMAKAIRDYAGKDKELHRIADALQDFARRSFYQATFEVIKVYGAGNYSHENTVTAHVEECYYSGWYPSNPSEWEDGFTEIVRDLCRWLYKSLETEYEWLTGDEQIAESLIANGLTFTEDGETY